MSNEEPRSVLVGDPHHAVSEGMRTLLATAFRAVVMVADEVSLFESAGRLKSDVAVIDLALARGNAIDLVRRLHNCFPGMRIIVISMHDGSSVSRSVLEAGADAFVAKRAIATDLLLAADAVLAGQRFVSPGGEQRREGMQ
jgi:two-component system secretion response regulator SsrB